MFGLFKRRSKSGSIDFSQIGVDIHSHLIPGVDDGAKDLADSITLIKGLKSIGFKKIITTPHIMSDYYPNSSEVLRNGLEVVRMELAKQEVDIEIDCAAEYYMDDYFENLLDKDDILTLPNNHVLVEMSFYSPPLQLNNYLFKLQTKGYKPILAHPERYVYFGNNIDKFRELKDLGCLLQMNVLSLVGYYGREVKSICEKLLADDLYDLIGTDTHAIRHIDTIKKEHQILQKLPLKKFKNAELFL